MQTTELIKKIKRIDIKSHRLTDEFFSGEYRSGFRGKGIEFENVRQYLPGDDVRNIDWNVIARHNKAYVKQFCEEREMNLILLIDVSASNSFGKKREMIAEISATLAFSAIRNNDRVGVVFFTGEIEKYIPSGTGRKHVLSIIDCILTLQPKRTDTGIANVLRYLNLIEKKSSVVILISDFLDSGYEKELKASAGRHDLIRVRVADRAEVCIPAGAVFSFEDLETGEFFVLDNTKQNLNLSLPESLSKRNLITLYTDEDYVKPIRAFFRNRGAK